MLSDCKSRGEFKPKNGDVFYTVHTSRLKAKCFLSYQSFSTSFSIALYRPFPNAKGDSETEGEGKKEAKRSVEGAMTMANVHVHAESSQFERVSGLKIVARGSRVT